ncbi:quinol monooxygenase YgiN [Rhodopseudomonas julia]|uniref:Quinol monooxygenase YgiN n=1 Tax=Rhodopseudomonas julia TaxID=200617 RepID=A0ABU0C710_9BRAD|nr:putative quinol monooxygenase [Rhodopseudomonas julia]MDQ0325686.1 quinol monooxygenase YgiN [Rhodopseudomonas julia]
MIIVAGEFRIPEDQRDAFLPAAQKVMAATRQETGCLLYTFAFDLDVAGLVRVFEKWESREALAAHFKTPHMAEWRQALSAIGVSGRSVKAYAADDGEPV